MTHLVENNYIYYETYCVLLPVHMATTAAKAVCKLCYGFWFQLKTHIYNICNCVSKFKFSFKESITQKLGEARGSVVVKALRY
jgi:hypothetical protein